jgi:hypothetical protein
MLFLFGRAVVHGEPAEGDEHEQRSMANVVGALVALSSARCFLQRARRFNGSGFPWFRQLDQVQSDRVEINARLPTSGPEHLIEPGHRLPPFAHHAAELAYLVTELPLADEPRQTQ